MINCEASFWNRLCNHYCYFDLHIGNPFNNHDQLENQWKMIRICKYVSRKKHVSIYFANVQNFVIFKITMTVHTTVSTINDVCSFGGKIVGKFSMHLRTVYASIFTGYYFMPIQQYRCTNYEDLDCDIFDNVHSVIM